MELSALSGSTAVSRSCPSIGRYEVLADMGTDVAPYLSSQGSPLIGPGREGCDAPYTALTVGCSASDTLEMHTSCSNSGDWHTSCSNSGDWHTSFSNSGDWHTSCSNSSSRRMWPIFWYDYVASNFTKNWEIYLFDNKLNYIVVYLNVRNICRFKLLLSSWKFKKIIIEKMQLFTFCMLIKLNILLCFLYIKSDKVKVIHSGWLNFFIESSVFINVLKYLLFRLWILFGIENSLQCSV